MLNINNDNNNNAKTIITTTTSTTASVLPDRPYRSNRCICIFIADNYMSKASDREEIKDETYQVQNEEQE